MLAIRELALLDAQRAVLLAESELNRQQLLAECAKLAPVVESVELGMGLVRRFKSVLAIAAPLLGIWAVRKEGARAGLWSKLSLGWQLWRSFRTARQWFNEAQQSRSPK